MSMTKHEARQLGAKNGAVDMYLAIKSRPDLARALQPGTPPLPDNIPRCLIDVYDAAYLEAAAECLRDLMDERADRDDETPDFCEEP